MTAWTYTDAYTPRMDWICRNEGLEAMVRYIKSENERMMADNWAYCNFWFIEIYEFEDYLLESYGGWFV